jgi:uncharacterized protein
MISYYPHFTKLSLENREEIVALTSRFAPYSDFNFSSLFSWNTDGSTEICLLNGNLVIKLPDYVTGEPTVSLIGDSQIDESIALLLGDCTSLNLIPEIVVQSLKQPEKFQISEDRDNFDYIYDLVAVAYMAGGKLKKKRNKVYAVRKAFAGRLTHSTLTEVSLELRSSLEAITTSWSINSCQSASDLRQEKKALSTLFANTAKFDLIITLITIDATPVAFSINEIIDEENAICHFEKATPAHEQLSSLVASQAAIDLLGFGCSNVNWEQDLGLEGMRKSKMAYQPTTFLKKYTIELAKVPQQNTGNAPERVQHIELISMG